MASAKRQKRKTGQGEKMDGGVKTVSHLNPAVRFQADLFLLYGRMVARKRLRVPHSPDSLSTRTRPA